MRLFFILSLIAFSSAFSYAQSPTIGGCPIFPADNPWNLDISQYPVHPKSAVFIAAINKTKQFLHADFGTPAEYGIPYIVVDSTQPFVPVTYLLYGDQSDPGPFPIPANAPVEGGPNASQNSDRHVLVIDKSNCMLYEFWQGSKDQSGSGWSASNGAKFDLTKNEYRPDGWTSADAAGLPIFPGLARYEEVAAGAINHALRFTVDNSQRGWIHPARHQAGKSDTTYPPMGLRLRLKANYDISNVTGQAKIILQALKKYGMINADNGSSWFISGTSNPLWDDNDLNQLKKIPGSAFEAVYTGPIKTQPAMISITAPKAGEIIPGGTASYSVKTTTVEVDSLRTLEFSSDGGITWMPMNGKPGTSTFTWSLVPSIATTTAMIRISDRLGTVATSNPFTITSKSAASISGVTVKNVVNGHIATGIQTTVSWTSSGNINSTLTAEYSTDNVYWTLISNTIPSASTSTPWTTPAASPTMYVRVRSTGDATITGMFGPFVVDGSSGVETNVSSGLSLSNYPNPVSEKAEIRFSLPRTEYVSLKIFNAQGIEVAILASGEMNEGSHTVSFNAHSLAQGIYFCRMSAGGEYAAKKMVIVR